MGSRPAAEGTARVVLTGRRPPRQLDPDALAKLINHRAVPTVGQAPASDERIVALEEFASGGLSPYALT